MRGSVSPKHVWAGLAALPLALAACSGQTSPGATEGTTTAQTQGSIVVYSGRAESLVAPLFEEFTAETGIGVSVRYGDTAELGAQLLEEGDRTPAQLYFAQDAGALGAVASAGLFAALPDAAADRVPADYRGADGTWTGVTGRARVIAYDSNQVDATDVPSSVFDLVDPTWKGQIAIAPTNASFQSFVTAMRISAGDDVTRQWLEGIVANDVQRYEKNSQILEAVNAGQVQLGLVNNYYWYQLAAELGVENMRAQLAFTAPGDPGSLVNISGIGILANAADNPAVATLVEWLLSDSIQRWFVENTFEYPMVPGVAAADGLPPLDSLSGPDAPLADLADLPGTLTMLEDVGLL